MTAIVTGGLDAVRSRIASIQIASPPTIGGTPPRADFAKALNRSQASIPMSSIRQPLGLRVALAAAETEVAAPLATATLVGTSPGDVTGSEMVARAFADVGVSMPASMQEQATRGLPVTDPAAAIAGDLVVFGDPANAVGIHAGQGRVVRTDDQGRPALIDLADIAEPIAVSRVVVAAPRGAPPQRSAHQAARTSGLWAPLFDEAGARHGVDPRLLAAVAEVESGFDPTAVSPAGAQGLMQFMPATAAEMGVDPFDPASAIDGAARYLAREVDRFGSVDLALAAYNAGPGAVQRHGGVPPYPETQNYVRKVIASWEARS